MRLAEMEQDAKRGKVVRKAPVQPEKRVSSKTMTSTEYLKYLDEAGGGAV